MGADGNLAALRIFRGAQCLRNPLVYYQNGSVNLTNSNSSQIINGLWYRNLVTCDRYLQSPPWVGGSSHSTELCITLALCGSCGCLAHPFLLGPRRWRSFLCTWAIQQHWTFCPTMFVLPVNKALECLWVFRQHQAAQQTREVIVLEWDGTIY